MFPNRDPKHFNSIDQATSGNVMWVTLQTLINLSSIKQCNNGSNRSNLLLLVVRNVLCHRTHLLYPLGYTISNCMTGCARQLTVRRKYTNSKEHYLRYRGKLVTWWTKVNLCDPNRSKAFSSELCVLQWFTTAGPRTLVLLLWEIKNNNKKKS